MTSFEFSKQRVYTRIPQTYSVYVKWRFAKKITRKSWQARADVNENHLMTHCFGWPKDLESLVRFAEKLREEFVFEVLLGLDFSRQPTTGLGAAKKRHPEKAGTIVIASSEFYGHRWFRS